MLAYLVAWAMAGQSPLDAKIDFNCPATRAEVALRQLSERAGVPLRAAASTASDILVIRVHAVPTQALLDRIASAARATWKIEGNTLYLTASGGADQRCHQLLANELAGRIGKALQARLDSPGIAAAWGPDSASRLATQTESTMNPPDGKLDGDSKPVQDLKNRSPFARASTRLLAAIGPEELAGHISEGRTVYSTDPTSMEVGMPPCGDILQQFLAEQTSFVDATNTFLAGKRPPDTSFSVTGIDRGTFSGGNPSRGVGKAIVRVSGDYRQPYLEVDSTITDGTGKILNDGRVVLNPDPRPLTFFAQAGNDAVIPPDPLAKSLTNASHVEAKGPQTQLMMSSVANGHMASISLRTPIPVREAPVSPDLLTWLLSPWANEPLRLGAGSLLLTTSQRRGDNLVADLDDRCFRRSLQLSLTKPTPSAWLSSPALQTDHEVAEGQGWLTISLRDPAAARQNRISRAGLTTFLAALQRHRVLRLDDVSEFAQTQYSAPEGFDFQYMVAVCPTAAYESYDPNSWPLYRLYGALTRDQRDDLVRGGKLSMASLTPAAETALRRMVYEGFEQPKLTDRAGNDVETNGSGIVTDWTELLPVGVPSGTSLGATTEAVPAVYCLSEVRGIADVESLADIARDRFVAQSAQYHEYTTGVSFDRFAPAKLAKYKFTFRFAPGIALEAELKDGVFDDAMAPVAFDQAPNDLRDGIAKEFAALKSAFGDPVHLGTRQSSNTPP